MQVNANVRILAIGFPLPNVSFDNYNPLTAPSYNDYDALVIDPLSITTTAKALLEEAAEYEAFDGRPVINAPTSASAVSAAEQFRRRADETRRLLEAGGLVVVLARPDAIHGGIHGFEGLDRYHWLPAPGGIAWGAPYLKPAEGKTVRITAEDHTFAEVLREFRRETGYRAVFDDRLPEVRRAGRVIAAGGGDIPIAMEFSVSGGRVVFLPVMAEGPYANRMELAQAVSDACLRLSGSESATDAPYWVRSQAIPGLEQLEAELEEAESAEAEARSHTGAVRDRHDALARHRRLLWEGGAAFQNAVVESLRILGFPVDLATEGPPSLEHEGATALIEVESSRAQVVEWPYVRLQRRLEERLLRQGDILRGLVVANGFREKEPAQREDELSQPLRVACENYGFALITATTLFELVKRALADPEAPGLLGVRRRIMAGKGLLTLEHLLGESSEEPRESGPIF